MSIYFEPKMHLGRSGYTYEYMNEYSGTRFSERINPKDIFNGISERSLETYLGCVADSDGTFREYLESVVARINKGLWLYCPQVI